MLKTLMLVSLAAVSFAQTETPKPAPEPVKYYRLDFVVKEVEGGKVINARSYAAMVDTSGTAGSQIRVTNKFPLPISPGSAQFNFADVGVYIDCGRAKPLQDQLALLVLAEISSLAAEGGALPPTVRQNKWSANVVLPLRKPTVLFSSDDLTSKRQMQLELTATPIK